VIQAEVRCPMCAAITAGPLARREYARSALLPPVRQVECGQTAGSGAAEMRRQLRVSQQRVGAQALRRAHAFFCRVSNAVMLRFRHYVVRWNQRECGANQPVSSRSLLGSAANHGIKERCPCCRSPGMSGCMMHVMPREGQPQQRASGHMKAR